MSQRLRGLANRVRKAILVRRGRPVRVAPTAMPASASSVSPGPLTRQLSEAYCRFVDFDFVGQYLKRLG